MLLKSPERFYDNYTTVHVIRNVLQRCANSIVCIILRRQIVEKSPSYPSIVSLVTSKRIVSQKMFSK